MITWYWVGPSSERICWENLTSLPHLVNSQTASDTPFHSGPDIATFQIHATIYSVLEFQGFCIKDLDLVSDYLFDDIMELQEWKRASCKFFF